MSSLVEKIKGKIGIGTGWGDAASGDNNALSVEGINLAVLSEDEGTVVGD